MMNPIPNNGLAKSAGIVFLRNDGYIVMFTRLVVESVLVSSERMKRLINHPLAEVT